jgi:nucleolar MIF4G domain-containing protein 1
MSLYRNHITHFSEIDVDMLLLIVSHAGFQLRLDDPSSLKDIVRSVSKRAESRWEEGSFTPSTRVQHMINVITDLKSNKRKRSITELNDKVSFFRKILGRIKTLSFQQTNVSSGVSSLCLRISLADIMNIEKQGRWWSVGSSWVGYQHNQNTSQDEKIPMDKYGREYDAETNAQVEVNRENDRILTLASRFRMNTDTRRAIFCIIMGSHDYEDAFIKLLQADMLKGSMEKDVVRVLIDCCCREQYYNPFYSHIAVRLCEHLSSMRFTFQLAFWDIFSIFNDENQVTLKKRDSRFTLNLAKLLSSLMIGGLLKLNVLKRLDITLSEMSEKTILFMTVLFTELFESITDPSRLVDLMKKGPNTTKKILEAHEDDVIETDRVKSLRQCLSAFFIKYLDKSPKNIKSSNFARNLKVALKVCDADDDEVC